MSYIASTVSLEMSYSIFKKSVNSRILSLLRCLLDLQHSIKILEWTVFLHHHTTCVLVITYLGQAHGYTIHIIVLILVTLSCGKIIVKIIHVF